MVDRKTSRDSEIRIECKYQWYVRGESERERERERERRRESERERETRTHIGPVRQGPFD